MKLLQLHKKNLIKVVPLLFFIFCLPTFSWGQTAVSYTAMTTVACPGAPVATISPAVTGLTFSQISRGSGVTCASVAGGVSGSGYNGSLATNTTNSAWYTFSVTSDATVTFVVSAISIQSRISNITGTPNVSIQYSIGAGAKSVIGSFTPTTGSAAYPFTPSISVGASQTLNIYVIPNTLTASTTTCRLENATSITVATTPVSGTTITLGAAPATFATQCINTTSTEKTYTVSGSGLTADIVITPPAGFEISTSTGVGFVANPSTLTLTQTAGVVATTTIYVRFSPTAVLSYDNNITHTSTGATTQNTALVGSGVNTLPTVTSPTSASITSTTATLGGNLTAIGCSNVTEQGIYWSITNGFADGAGTKVSVTPGPYSAGVYTIAVGSLPTATLIYYKAFCTNGAGSTYTVQGSFTTLKAEPGNFPTLFACGTTTSSTIPLTWTDAAAGVLPDGYLIKWSSTSYAAIAAPADGTAEADGAGVKNTTQGTQTYTATGLTSSTTYYFKIWSYTNSGTGINYKLTAEPQTSCATLSGPSITLTGALSAFGNQCINTASAEQTYTVAGSNLTANIVITALAGYEIALTTGGADASPITLAHTAGTVNTTTIYIRFKPTTVAAYNGNITHASTGVTTVNQAVSGTGITTATAGTTTAVTAITTTTASGGGNPTADGGSAITAKGVCWNTATTPTTANSLTNDGTATGAFTSSLTGLTAATLYYVRSYSTNACGTTYGTEVTFTTLKNEPTNFPSSFACGVSTSSTIPLTWVDAAAGVLPDNYLIKWSTTSYAAIADPIDGTAEANAAGVRNVAQGAQAYTFTALTSSTTYYFKIWSYTNTGTGINYKLVGEPQTSCATIAPTTPTITAIGDLVNFGNQNCIGTPTAAQTYTVAGINLTANLVLHLSSTFFEFSTDGITYQNTDITLIPVGGIVNTTTIYVRYAPTSTATKYLTINNTSTGATTVVTQSAALTNVSATAVAVTATTNPANTSVEVGSPASFSITGTGGSLTYQWQESTDAGATFHTITDYASVFTGTTTNSLSIAITGSGMNSYQYQCIVSGTCGTPATSTPATLTVTALANDVCGTTQAFTAATAPAGWTFTPTTLATYTTAGNFGAASPSIKLLPGSIGGTNRILTASASTSVTQLSFWIKGQTSGSGDQLLIEGFDGTWNTIENITSFNNATGGTITYNSGSTPALAAGFTKFRFTYTKGTGGVAIDDIAFTCGAASVTPTTQISALATLNVGVYGFQLNWTNGNGIKRLVRINTTNSFTDPIDGLYYPSNPHYDCTTEQTIYNSGNNKCVIMGLTPNTLYYFKIWEYNGSGTTSKYMLTGNPASSFTTSTINTIDKAYNDFDNVIKWFFHYTTTGSAANGYAVNNFTTNTYGETGTIGFDKYNTLDIASGGALSTTTVYMDPINAKNLTGISLQYKLASSQDLSSTGEGVDVADYVECYLLRDGVRAATTYAVTTYGTGNEVFPFDAAKTYSGAYNADATATNTGAANASSYYTITIPDAADATTEYKIEVVFKLVNNRTNEHWTLDDVKMVSTGTLPISLLSFTAKLNAKKVDLNWVTASELNNDYFTIERSADAVHFHEINVTDGAGNSNQVLSYSTVDDAPLSGLSYYRLKQTDFNGQFSYSNIVSVNMGNTDGFQIVNTFNTIEHGSLDVTVNCGSTCLVNFELIDMTGKKVYASTQNITGNNKTISVPTATLSHGIYMLKAYNGKELISKKVKL